MKQLQLFYKTLKNVPKDAAVPSHRLLLRGGFIEQVAAGRYALLPLGHRVYQKIIEIIDTAMRRLGSQRIGTPTLHPIEVWQQTNRDKAFGAEMHLVEDHQGNTFAIGATAEGLMTDLVKKSRPSYRDLPIVIHQFSQKFRDEKRPRGGLLRLREFMMKDAYSFHADEKDLLKWYDIFYQAYIDIANKLDLKVIPVEADSGAIGGDYNHEFMVESAMGEDTIFVCSKCDFAISKERAEFTQAAKAGRKCAKCGQGVLTVKQTIEWGHTFHQGQFYTKPQGATFTDSIGQEQVIWQGAYGIGVERTMATIVETHHDQRGIFWPRAVTPFHAHLLNLKKNIAPPPNPPLLRGGARGGADTLYDTLQKAGFEILYDDREASAGEKFAEADLLGITIRLVVSDKAGDRVEWKERVSDETELLDQSEVITKLENFYQ